MLGVTRLAQTLEEYLEKKSGASLLFQIVSLLISLSGAVLGIFKLPSLSFAAILLLFALTLFLLVLNDRLFRKNKELARLVTFLVDVQPQKYKYTEIEENETITTVGDGISRHRYVIAASSSDVYWFRFKTSITSDVPPARFDALGFTVKNVDGVALKYFVYNDAARVKEIIVCLHTPAVPGSPYTLNIEYSWRACWKTLLSTCADAGYSAFEHDVDKYKFVLTFPSEYRAQGMYVNPSLPDSTIVTSEDGKIITWAVANIPPNQYRFDLSCSRTS